MSMLQVGLIGIVGIFLAFQFQNTHREYSVIIAITIAVYIFIQVILRLTVVVEAIESLQSMTSIGIEYIEIVLKMLGITFVAEFASSLCKENGLSSVASQIQLFGKVYILMLSMPILLALLETIDKFIA